MHLAISVVSNRDQNADFTISLINLLAWLASSQHPFDSVRAYLKTGCSLLPAAREEAIEECLAEGVTHMMCFDDDMTFPPDTVMRLYQHGQPFVACNSLRKNPKALLYTAHGLDSKMVKSRDKTGLEEVSRVGLAIALLDLRVISKIEKPRFEVIYNKARGQYLGEDMYFCDKMRSNGVKIHIDHGLSNECGHIGSFVYKFNIYGGADGNQQRVAGERDRAA